MYENRAWRDERHCDPDPEYSGGGSLPTAGRQSVYLELYLERLRQSYLLRNDGQLPKSEPN